MVNRVKEDAEKLKKENMDLFNKSVDDTVELANITKQNETLVNMVTKDSSLGEEDEASVETVDTVVPEFPLAPMGVLAPVSAHAGPSAQPPIGTSGNFLPHLSAESPSNISPSPSKVISDVSDPYDNLY